MSAARTPPRLHRPRPARAQRGAALLFALIAVAVMLIATAGLMRSVDTSQQAAGALADRRDQLNKADRAVAAAIAHFVGTGLLVADATREATLKNANYWPTTLATNAAGIPTALLASDATFNVNFNTANDIAAGPGISLRYVIDRMCVGGTGAPSIDNCMVYQRSSDKGGSHRIVKAGTTVQWVYRISVRVLDARRNTLTFVQTTLGA